VVRTLPSPKPYVFWLFLAPIILIFFLNAIFPIFISIYYSTTDWAARVTYNYIGFQNYVELATDMQFWNSARNNLIIVALCVVGQVGIALIISFLLVSKKLRLKEFHRTVIFFPVTVSALVIGFIWSIMYNSRVGLVNFFMRLLGLENFILPWLDDPSYILITASIPVMLQFVGLYMIMFMGAIKGIPDEVLECASLDGCNDRQRSFYIILPMIYSTFKVAIMICVAGTMRIFEHIMVLTNGGPGTSSQVLALYAYRISFDRMRLGYGSTVAIGILILSLALTMSSRALLGGKKYA